MNKSNKIIFAFSALGIALILAAQFVYFYTTLNDSHLSEEELDARIEKGIENYVEKQIKEQQDAVEAQQTEIPTLTADDMAMLIEDDAVKGDSDAKITIVEFSDYECPYCGKYVSETYSLIKENYIDTGKVKYVFRDFPLSFHQNAYGAAHAAECAGDLGGDEKYFEMHDLLFTNQSDLSAENYLSFAEEIGLDSADFNECMESDRFNEEITADALDGQKYGVSGTPGFFINGTFIAGAYPYEAFEDIIEDELSK